MSTLLVRRMDSKDEGIKLRIIGLVMANYQELAQSSIAEFWPNDSFVIEKSSLSFFLLNN